MLPSLLEAQEEGATNNTFVVAVQGENDCKKIKTLRRSL
jgi:hypothetical protein